MACPESPSSDDLTAFLARQDPEHDALSFSWNDTVPRWNLDEVAQVSRAVLQNRTVTSVPVNLATAAVDPELTSQILGCFQSVSHLQLACPFTRRDDDVSPDVVDALLRGISVSPSHLRSFETTRSGGSAAIVEFCDRFRDDLDTFGLGIGYRACDLAPDFELGVSLGLARLPALKRVSLFCSTHRQIGSDSRISPTNSVGNGGGHHAHNVGRRHIGNRRNQSHRRHHHHHHHDHDALHPSRGGLSRIVTSLVASPALEKAELIVCDDDQLSDAARLCTYSRSLREVAVEARYLSGDEAHAAAPPHPQRTGAGAGRNGDNDDEDNDEGSGVHGREDDEEGEEEEDDEEEEESKTPAERFLRQARFLGGTLESLALQNFHFSNFEYATQPNLRSLTLTECDLEPGSLSVLQSFPNLASLKLSGCLYRNRPGSSGEATEGAAASSAAAPAAAPTDGEGGGGDHPIRPLLRNLPNLTSFESTYLETLNNSEVSALSEINNNHLVAGIAKALCHSPGRYHPSLKSVTLKLYGERVTESDRNPLYFPALRQLMRVAETLVLYCTEFAWTNVHHLVGGLQRRQRLPGDEEGSGSSRLRHLTLHLEDCSVTREDYATFFRTVATTQLKSFCVDFDNCDRLVPPDPAEEEEMDVEGEDDDDDGGARDFAAGGAAPAAALVAADVEVNQSESGNVGDALVELLRTNRTLETLELYYVSGSLFNQLLGFLILGLQGNATLSRLLIRQNAVGSVRVSAESAAALLGLLRINTSLRVIEPLQFDEGVDEAVVSTIHRYLRLNRYGRQFLRSPILSAGTWPHILERVAANQTAVDVMQHFLRVMPSLVRAPRRGRRRGRSVLEIADTDSDADA